MRRTRSEHPPDEDDCTGGSRKSARCPPKTPSTTAVSRNYNSEDHARPTQAEREAALKIIDTIDKSPFKSSILPPRSNKPLPNVVALALALYFGEEFDSDAKGKDLFQVGYGTDVKGGWVDGRLPRLFEVHPDSEAAASPIFKPQPLLTTSPSESMPAAAPEPPVVGASDSEPAQAFPSALERGVLIREHMCAYACALQDELAHYRSGMREALYLADPRFHCSPEVREEFFSDWTRQVKVKPWETVARKLFDRRVPLDKLEALLARQLSPYHHSESERALSGVELLAGRWAFRAHYDFEQPPTEPEPEPEPEPLPAVTTLAVREEVVEPEAVRARAENAIKVVPIPRGDGPPVVATFDY